jgi:GTP-binding protein HflX
LPPQRAIVVAVDLPGADIPLEDDLAEALELTRATGGQVVGTLTCRRGQVDPALFIGSGKAAELAELVAAVRADLVIVNQALSPSQERNLERLLKCQVLDRIGLILDIFARRARSHEGKLQVELAQLRHLSTRLVRGWTHLERQKGGIGLRGPGESQLETDRRLLRVRLRQLEARLSRVVGQRQNSRRQRERSATPTVALVGYTNSGKSTLFNALTASEVFAADLLFATLDSTLRRLELPDCEPLVLVDTVGFVRRLPHDLVAAFRSTLEEVRSASLLLHVVDSSREDQRQLMLEQVNTVLQEIGAGDIPQIEVMNKIDLTGREPARSRGEAGGPERVWLSARTGAGLDLLRTAVGERFADALTHQHLRLPSCDGRLRAQVFELGQVRHEQFDADGAWQVEFDIRRQDLGRLAPLLGAARPVEQ